VLTGFLSWLDVPGAKAGAMLPPSPDLTFDRAPVVVVWQSESFLDMRRLGVDGIQLPCLDALRQRATAYGLMGQVFEGGYTMRTEFAVLRGLDPAAMGMDAAHPYLRARRYGSDAWPSRLRQSGWRTHFLHPYDRTFFLRHRAIPELGFERLTMLDDFGHVATPEVPYVTDQQLTDRVIELCRNEPATQPSFIFAASMGNHGPWNDFRGGKKREPVDLYCHLLEHADAALGTLAEALERLDRPVMLVFYGDHAPLLKGFADPFPDPRTDYLIVPLGPHAKGDSGAVEMTDIDAWHLLATAFAQLSTQPNGPVPGGKPAAPDQAT
jgi:phosphoglycerol transferase MdoB-like AlkP superfamily enzyme